MQSRIIHIMLNKSAQPPAYQSRLAWQNIEAPAKGNRSDLQQSTPCPPPPPAMAAYPHETIFRKTMKGYSREAQV